CPGGGSPHRFGGLATHHGATPPGTETPLHLFLTLDLADANCPAQTDAAIRYLPLYYPLKYGRGGPGVQDCVVSDTEVQILHLSPDKPDEERQQYVKVPSLPESRARIIPLSYEEALILGFMAADQYFQPNTEDDAILNRLDWNNLVAIGGTQISVRDAQDV